MTIDIMPLDEFSQHIQVVEQIASLELACPLIRANLIE